MATISGFAAVERPRRRDLRPAAGRGAEIDDALARREQPVAVVELDQLEGRAGAIAFGMGARDVGDR